MAIAIYKMERKRKREHLHCEHCGFCKWASVTHNFDLCTNEWLFVVVVVVNFVWLLAGLLLFLRHFFHLPSLDSRFCTNLRSCSVRRRRRRRLSSVILCIIILCFLSRTYTSSMSPYAYTHIRIYQAHKHVFIHIGKSLFSLCCSLACKLISAQRI